MPEYEVVRVFVGEDGGGGNELGVFLDGKDVPDGERQPVATELGFPETVFVDDRERAELRLYTPATELPFAGHPMVGTAWLLDREGDPVEVLRPTAGEVAVRREDGLIFIRARPAWSPRFDYIRLGSPAEVEALTPPHPDSDAAYCWAWEDESEGTVRARALSEEYGIAEDEATGSAAICLCSQLGRPLRIHQGRGSLLRARPFPDGTAEVGGRVEPVERREISLPG
jgi:predicted PhzF superfamily epimerase YddE/YHI9